MSDSRTRASYHHGSLRETLVRASLELIRAEGIGAVSLRRVAREAGVSPGAPYHHFPDRAALLTAIAGEGFGMLEERLVGARAAAASPAAALTAMTEAYVRFAHEQPAYFHLMFRPELARPDKDAAAKQAAERSFQVLCDVVADCQLAGDVPAGDPGALVTALWALAHGLASLWVDGPLDGRATPLAGSTEALVTQIAQGVATVLAGAARAGVRLGP
ncbi:TetR/AcrR family transcriptional regulator [Pseudonocardia humida]|uniref:TetR/AcrR family transcriptional regulator n=1 Tax=Pseudonocardia humida TaxID=2800819 RepID=A0ABT1A7C6_9PSEU|nr:WHG domain-containing protein [Pseudonocardia humida]MCO1658913.1 TetR/AcrR family transcriptional regulator [Pseudonocardia humida]